MRLFKSIDHTLDARAAYARPGPLWLRRLRATNDLNKALRMVFDHVQWAGNVGLLGRNGRFVATRMGDVANVFWLGGILTSLGLNAYALLGERNTTSVAKRALYAARQAHRAHGADGSPVSDEDTIAAEDAAAESALAASATRQRALLIDLARDLGDLPVPAFGLGLTPKALTTGHVGLSGSVSSLIGLYQVWSAVLAKMPAINAKQQ